MVALSIECLIPRRWVAHPLLGRGVHGTPGCGKIGSQFGRNITPVECGIGGRNIRHEPARVAQVGVVPGAVDEPQDPPSAIGAGVDLGTDPAARAAKRLRLRRAVCGPRGGAMSLAGGAVSQHQAIGRHRWTQVLKDQSPPATDTPAAEAVINAGPVAQCVRKVPPRCAGPQDPQHGGNKPAKTCLVMLPSVRNPLYHQHQRYPIGVVQVRPGHGRAPLAASNTPKVARPTIRSRTAPA